jgi:hypothetical protein
MVRICVVGNVQPQPYAIVEALTEHRKALGIDFPLHWPMDGVDAFGMGNFVRPDLLVIAGYRRLIPPEVLAIPRLGTVGFHSAKLPEYPGRAPVPWTLVRGDTHAYNTMLFLDEGVDSGDIIDQESRPIEPGDTPATLYEWIAESNVRMLLRHLPALKEGRAPRTPQDPALRGPLTSKDGWQVYENLTRREYAHG